MKKKIHNFDWKLGTVRNYFQILWMNDQWPHIGGWAVLYRNVINTFLIHPKTTDSRSSIMQSKNLKLGQWGRCLSLINESKSSLLGLLPLIICSWLEISFILSSSSKKIKTNPPPVFSVSHSVPWVLYLFSSYYPCFYLLLM